MRRALDGQAVTPSLRDTLVLRERALQSTTVGVVISDVRLPDNPVVWVNAAFTTTTGYTPEQAIGRNCRFLQGPETDQDAVAEMRSSVREQRASMVTLLNYRADGSTFWNSVSTAPVCDLDGEVIGFIGIQVDVTEQVLAQRAREARLLAESAAGALPEADETLRLLARVNDALREGDERAMMAALAAQLVPAFADNCAIDLVASQTEPSQLARAAAASIRPPAAEVGDPALVARVVRTGRPVSVVDHLAAAPVGAGQRQAADTDAEALISVPLQGRTGVLGALTLVSDVRSRKYDDAHLAVALDIGRRAGLAIESARLVEQEQLAADALRASLTLPPDALPAIELTVAAGEQSWQDAWASTDASWLVVGVLPADGADRPVSVSDLAGAAAISRLLRSRTAETSDLAPVLQGISGIWLGRLAGDGTLAYASSTGRIRPQVHRGDGDEKPESACGEITLGFDLLEVRLAATPDGPSVAGGATVLTARRRSAPPA